MKRYFFITCMIAVLVGLPVSCSKKKSETKESGEVMLKKGSMKTLLNTKTQRKLNLKALNIMKLNKKVMHANKSDSNKEGSKIPSRRVENAPIFKLNKNLMKGIHNSKAVAPKGGSVKK